MTAYHRVDDFIVIICGLSRLTACTPVFSSGLIARYTTNECTWEAFLSMPAVLAAMMQGKETVKISSTNSQITKMALALSVS